MVKRLRSDEPGDARNAILQAEAQDLARGIVTQDYLDDMKRLDADFERQIQDYNAAAAALVHPAADPLLDILAEYKRRARVLRERQGCLATETDLQAPFAVVALGNDESLQLGNPHHVKLLMEGNNQYKYAPLYLPDSLHWNRMRKAEGQQQQQLLLSPAPRSASGGLHSVTVGVDASRAQAYTWGAQDDGALGRHYPGLDDDEAQPEEDEEAAPPPVLPTNGDDEDETMAASTDIADYAVEMAVAKPTPVALPILPSGNLVEDAISQHVIDVRAGDSSTLFLTAAGTVFVCGSYKDSSGTKFRDAVGEDSVEGHHDKPVLLSFPGDRKIVEIRSGLSYNAALDEDGETIYTWGMGHMGELCRDGEKAKLDPQSESLMLGRDLYWTQETDENGKERDVLVEQAVRKVFMKPQPVNWPNRNKRQVLDMDCGAYHFVVAVREDGAFPSFVYTSGLNSYGQLGHGDDGRGTERHVLTRVEHLKDANIVQVAAGEFFTLALNLRGDTLYSFGRGDQGCLGNGKTYKRWGLESLPTKVCFASTERVLIDRIEAADRHALAVTIDQEVYTWGFGETGATGHETEEDEDVCFAKKLDLEEHLGNPVRVVQASGGGQHSLLVVQRYKKESATST